MENTKIILKLLEIITYILCYGFGLWSLTHNDTTNGLLWLIFAELLLLRP